MEKTADKAGRQANAAAGYGPNDPEPAYLREEQPPKDQDALHAAGEYIGGQQRSKTRNTIPTVYPDVDFVNRTEP